MKTTISAIAALALALIAPVAAPAATVGSKRVHARVATKAPGVVGLYRFKAPSSGRVDRLNVYLDARNTARRVTVGLYSGSATRALRRRAQCVISRPEAGVWNRCSIAPARVTAGRFFGLAVLQPSRSKGRLRYRERKRAGSRARSQASIYADQLAPAAYQPPETTSPGQVEGPTPATDAAPDHTPSPTPQPTPSPTPPPAAPPPPPPPGFPSAANTGVPAGAALTPYTGPNTIQTPGTVIEGKTVGCLRVNVPGVVIRNSRIACSSGYAVYVPDGAFSGTPLLIEDSEIDCQASTGTAIGEANFTVRRTEITGCQNGGDLNQNVVYEDSLIHNLSNAGSDPHEDGVQFAWGHVENGQIVAGSKNITLTHNTIYAINADGSFGTSAIISNRGGDTNVLIQGNLLAGGAVAIYCEQGAKGVNYRVLDNAFSRRFSSKVGFYGVSTDCSDETQSGNYYYETGQPLTLP